MKRMNVKACALAAALAAAIAVPTLAATPEAGRIPTAVGQENRGFYGNGSSSEGFGRNGNSKEAGGFGFMNETPNGGSAERFDFRNGNRGTERFSPQEGGPNFGSEGFGSESGQEMNGIRPTAPNEGFGCGAEARNEPEAAQEQGFGGNPETAGRNAENPLPEKENGAGSNADGFSRQEENSRNNQERPEISDPRNGRNGKSVQNGFNPQAENSRNNQERPDAPTPGNRRDAAPNQSGPQGEPSQNEEAPQIGEPNGVPNEASEGAPNGAGGFERSEAPSEYEAAATLTEDSKGQDYSSENDDENAVLASGTTVSLADASVSKTGSSENHDADFYGINAAILAKDGANLTVSGTEVSTDGTHANGIFSYGQGTKISVSDAKIKTSGDNSGGLMTTGGAEMTADGVEIETSGRSSAAIRSDRGGGKVVVRNSAAESSGTGSPAVYSTADVTVENSTLKATDSEAVVIEGGNSVTLNGCEVFGNDKTLNGQSTVKTNVLIYQSMSGDAQEGSSSFSMTGGSLSAETGVMFHVTNATTEITLEDVELSCADEDFLTATADAWGNEGKNGGNVKMNLVNQKAEGNVVIDSVSSLELNVSEGSTYEGAVLSDGEAEVSLDEDSEWILTGDSRISKLTGSKDNVDLNGYSLYVNGELFSE